MSNLSYFLAGVKINGQGIKIRFVRAIKMQKNLSLRLRISLMIIFILTFALLLNMFLSFSNFEKNYTNIIYSRFFVIAKDLQNTAEYGLNLGLSLPELVNIQEVINDVVREQRDIVFIRLFNDRGKVIFDTDRGGKDGSVPNEWTEKLAGMDSESMSKSVYDDARVVLLPLMNTFNIKAGALALGFSKSHIAVPVKEMLIYLFRYFVMLSAIFAAITLAGVSLFSRNVVRDFSTMLSVLKGYSVSGSAPMTDMQLQLVEFREKSAEAMRKIEDASKELERIDNKGKVGNEK